MNLYPASKTARQIQQEDSRTRQELSEFLSYRGMDNVRIGFKLDQRVNTKPVRRGVKAGDNDWQNDRSVKR